MLAVERLGEGPPVLFVHGDIVGPDLTWRKQRELAERWSIAIPSRPGFGESPAIERNDFEVEAPMFAELLGDGAHLVGHSYGAVIALLAAAQRPEAVRSLTVSEPGCLRVAAGNPVVDEMISNGERLFAHATEIPSEDFLRLFRGGAGSAFGTPDQLPEELLHGVELLKRERPSWEADIPLERLPPPQFSPPPRRRRFSRTHPLRRPRTRLRGGLRRPRRRALRGTGGDPGTRTHRSVDR